MASKKPPSRPRINLVGALRQLPAFKEMERWGVHKTHCCDKHGCKYGDKDCPVVDGHIKQDHPCETCGMGSKQEGGFYERVGKKLVWRPTLSDIVLRVYRQLGPKGKGKLTPKALRDLAFAAHVLQDDEAAEFLG